MPTFGDYESVGEPLAVINLQGHISTVWKARKTGAHDGRDFAVKSYAPHRRSKEGGHEESLDRDRGLEFLEGVKQLKKAQTKGARHLSPIHDLGISSEGAWYVTDYYPRSSLMALIERRAKVDSAALRQIIRCIVSGCLALKESRGVSHGNLKASNVFLVGKPRPLPKTPLLLADPYPAAPLQLARLEVDDRRTVGELLHQVMEVQDLRALGEIILQLVERRPVRSGYDYNYPIGRSEAWDNLGKDGERWRQICNQLLDPQLSLAEINLESLAKKFPAGVAGNKLVVIASALLVICLIVGGAYGFMRWSGPPKPKAGDHAGAMTQADLALESKPNDEAARQLKTDAKAQQNALLAAGQKQRDYDAAMQSGRAKLNAGDYAGAMTQADLALESKLNDKAARQLKTDAKAQHNASLAAGRTQKDYDRAIQGGQTAFDRGDYTTAVAQANAALAVRKSDPAATKLREDAQAKIDELRDKEQRYQTAMKSGQAAFDRGDYATAVTQADAALAVRGADPAATKLKKEAEAKIDKLRDKEQWYQTAMKSGQAAFDRGDYDNAVTQADAALAVRKSDPAATKLREDAQAKIDDLRDKEQRYQTAMKSGEAAFDRGDYANAVTQADAALAVRKSDPAATKLKEDAQAKIDDLRDKEQRYQTAMKSSQAAFDRGDYTNAVTQADTALAVRGADPAATKLKKNAEAKIDELRDKEQRYQTAMKSGEAAFDRGDYANAVTQADAALAVRGADPAATKLKKEAEAKIDELRDKEQRYQTAMKSSQAAFDRGDYANAVAQANAALAVREADQAATKLKKEAEAKIDDLRDKEQRYQTAMKSGQAAFDQRRLRQCGGAGRCGCGGPQE